MARAVRRSIKRRRLELEARRVALKIILAVIGMLLFGLLFRRLLPEYHSRWFHHRH
jgi:Zn-dependent protease